MSTEHAVLQRTPLYEQHVQNGGRMVPFAGWEMPVQYSGVIAEHQAVRSRAGVFDVSHMGELLVSGDGAVDFLQYCLSNDITRPGDGDGQYTLLMNAHGGINDDLIAYRLADGQFLLVVNAANASNDCAYLEELASLPRFAGNVQIVDHSDSWCMLAVQGPTAFQHVKQVLGIDLEGVGSFRIITATFADCDVLVATTGYTGELGCEILIPPAIAEVVWNELLESGVTPCGLGARDTLRLEVCYPLHGNDIDSETNPISAKLGWVCAAGTGFIGEEHVVREKEQGPATILTAVKASERGVLRPGMAIRDLDGNRVGELSSGTLSPSLNIGIGLGYLDRSVSSVGTSLIADVRGRSLPVEVVKPPFVQGSVS